MRPADLRISESEMWPRMIAAMEAGRKNVKIPQTRLAMALPLVGASPATGGGVAEELPGTGAGADVIRAAAEEGSGFPHFEQNCRESGLAIPQFLAKHHAPPILLARKYIALVNECTEIVRPAQAVSIAKAARGSDNNSRMAAADTVIVILAAGKGTRMRSDLAKVLHRAGGRAADRARDTRLPAA